MRVRGDIARIQLYMLDTYGEKLGFSFTEELINTLLYLAGLDPIDSWELERNKRICEVQGQGNHYVSECE